MTAPAAAVRGIFPGTSDMASLMRQLDWSKTPVGPPEHWPESLRTAVRICLTSRYPIFITWGPSWTLFYNDAYRPALGHKHPRFLGGRFGDAWSDIWDVIGPMAEGVLETGEATWSEDLPLVFDRSGYAEEVYYTFSYSPLKDEEGRNAGLFCACIETTDRVLQERRLQTLRDMTIDAKSLEEAGRKAGVALDRNPHDLPFSLLYLRDDQASRLKLLGSSGFSSPSPYAPVWLDPKDGSAAWPIGEVLASRRPLRVDGLRSRGLPSPRWPEPPSSAYILPIARPGHDEPTGALVLGISPRRAFDDRYRGFFELLCGHAATIVANARALEEERERARALAELDLAKTAFFSNVSHEFRTPLTLLLGPIQEVLSDRAESLAPTHRERLETAQRNALRLLKLTNTLLEFARIEAGRAQASYEPTDLGALTIDLASTFRSVIETAGIRLVVDCPPSTEHFWVDREMWEKIVLNLLSNAFKFTFEGEIAVVLRAAGGVAELEVRDTGTGIPPEELPNLFKRFHRIRGGRARSHEGSGIGLALIQELVRLHGGTVEAESTVGRGSSFKVRIPAGKAHLPPDRVQAWKGPTSTELGAAPFLEEARQWLPERQAAAPDPAAAPADRILVADDNADMRAYIARILTPTWKVETVADGRAALDRILQDPPDLLVADIMMPVLGGLELLRKLRSDSRTAGVPVILLSARAGEESRAEGLALAADDYMVKPFAAQALVSRVRSLLELSRLRRVSSRTENQFRLIADAIPALISYVDPESRYVFTNRAYEQWFDRPSHEVRGKHVKEILGERAYTNIRPHLEHALSGHRVTFEAEVRHRTGDMRSVEVTYVPDIRADGAVAGIFVLVLDMTERKKAERALRESEERFRNMADHAPVMIWMTRADGTCTYIGQSWYEFTGQTPETALDFGWLQALHPDDREHAEKEFLGANARREAFRLEYRLRRLDGEYRWVMDAGAPRFGSGGEFLGYIGSVIDITDRKRVEEEIRDRVRLRTAELEASNKELESFSYTVAHDLRSPLRAMHRYGEVLRETYADRPLDEEGLGFLGRIESSAKRMDVLIEGLLALTRLAREEPSSEPVDVEPVFHEALLQLESDVAARSADVRFEGPSHRVRGDRLLLRQVLTNYLSNALKFVPDDRRPVVRVSVDVLGDRLRTTVRDNGVGFPPESRSKLFQIFERLEGAREYPGTGIGLAIAKKAAERMGGRVGAEGEPGKGSRFWVDLPRLEAS
jgi:PAS domain S-box-containing protein